MLAAICALALFTRFWAIDHKSLWLDEVVSSRFANASLANVFDLSAHDVHPPLYYGVLHFWVGLAGNSEAALRAPSAIFGAATIVLLALVAWRAGGWLLAAAAALLLLPNAAYLTTTQEARMYSLLGLLVLTSSVALANFIAKPSPLRFVPYSALAIGLIYTDYNGFIAIGVQGLVFAVYGLDRAIRNRNGWILVAGLVLVGVLVLAYVPWWSTFSASYSRPGGPTGYPPVDVELVTNIGRSALGLDRAGGGWLALALPLLLLGVYGLAKRWRNPYVLSVGAIALVPVGQILVSVWLQPVLNLRRVTPYIPGLAFVCALGLVEAAALFRRAPRLAPAGYVASSLLGVALLIVMALQVQERYTAPALEDWRSVNADLAGTSDPIFIAPGWQEQSLVYYRGTSLGVTQLGSLALKYIQDGAVPVPLDQLQRSGILIVQGSVGEAVVPSFQRYFDVEGRKQYPGRITVYSLHPLFGPP